MKRMLALVLALVMVIGLMPGITASAQTTDRVADLVANMSLRDKVTQMMMVDFRMWGATVDSAKDFTEMNDEVRKIIEDYNFGSIILFANNIKETEQSYNLVYAMQEAATKDDGIALIVCADQEGGSVYRLGSGTALPGNMALGATYAANGTKYAYEAGKIIGSELSVLGINGNLAPVVDVNNNANNPVIGLRSYSDDATMVGELASASIAGMAEYNVIGTAKHFPGHGDTATDSHYGLPSVDKSLEVLMENELKPYTVAIDQGIEMIMTAHILYPQLESDKIYSNKTKKEESLPATMSDDILTGLLKEDMGFEGIVVTDAMNMAGIADTWDQVQSVIIAINAGVDLFCMPCRLYCQADLANLDAIINGVIAAVESGEISMDRINDAVTRILTVKENRGILDYNAADYSLEKALEVVGSDANREMEREIAAAAVTVVKNDGTLPLQLTENSKVLMLCPYNNERAQLLMGWNRAKEAGLVPEGAEVDYFRFSSTTISEELQTKLDWADTYIIVTEVSSTARMNYKHWLSAMPNALCDYAAANGKKAVIASCDKPYDVQMYPNANAILAAYGCKGSSVDPTEAIIGGATGSAAAYGPNIIAAVEVALGTFDAQGKLPVNIPVYDAESNSYTDELVYERGYGLTYRVPKLMNEMSLRDKVTQMMMVDFRMWGDNVDSAKDFTVMNEEVQKIIEDYNFGSIILFANNIKETEQSYNLTMAMQEAATKDGGLALIICADQEGGSVYRLGSGTALPGNMALGATYAANGTKYALHAGQIIGSELDAVGINGNLAPVVDVNNNANNPVIGLRSYGDDATMVGELASAVIAGMAEYNVIGTAKHFPGHGDTATDSHYGLPMVDKSLEVLKEVELKPYEVAIDQGIEMIMTAHILYPQLEGDKIVSNKTGEPESLPATMSDDILTGLLKEDMGFEGIIVTDAMNMAGIADKWDQVQSTIIAVNAGADLFCMPCRLYCQADLANLDAIINGVIAAVESGEIPMERINDAVRRILTVKENRGILDYDPAEHTLEKALEVVGSDANRAKERELAAAAVTVVKNDGSLPLELNENSKVLMLVPYDNERSQMLMAWNRAKEACLIPAGAEVDYYRFKNATIGDDLKEKLDWADTYIINSEISSTSRFSSNHWLYAMPTKLCDYAAANGKTAIISSVDKPYDVQMYANANAIVAAYGCKGSSVDPTEALIGGATGSAAAYGPNIIAAVEVILGTYAAQGKLPVNVPVYDAEAKSYSDVMAYERGFGLTYEAKAPEHHTWNGLECAYCDATRVNPFTDVPVDSYYLEPALWAMDHGFTAGNGDGTFGPADDLLRCQVVTMLWSAAGKPVVEIENPFTDVKESDYFYNAVLWAYSEGITGGVSATKFDPAGITNRAQAITFLWSYLGKPEAETASTFADIPAGSWCAAAVSWAVENGVTAGMTKKMFGPTLNCKRVHMVTFLYNALA